MDIVHKMRLHASVDQLCVDDINASNIHGMLQFAREDCFSIKKDLIDDCAETKKRFFFRRWVFYYSYKYSYGL